jgi:hypothetical protein
LFDSRKKSCAISSLTHLLFVALTTSTIHTRTGGAYVYVCVCVRGCVDRCVCVLLTLHESVCVCVCVAVKKCILANVRENNSPSLSLTHTHTHSLSHSLSPPPLSPSLPLSLSPVGAFQDFSSSSPVFLLHRNGGVKTAIEKKLNFLLYCCFIQRHRERERGRERESERVTLKTSDLSCSNKCDSKIATSVCFFLLAKRQQQKNIGFRSIEFEEKKVTFFFFAIICHSIFVRRIKPAT